jgi:hypothetical protein
MATKKSVKSSPSTKKHSYSMTALSEEKVKQIEKEFLEQNKQKKSKTDYPKILKVSFRSTKDCDKFALLIQQTIDYSEKQIDFKIPNWRNHGKWRFTGEPKLKSTTTGLKPEHAKHWVDMPEFEQEKNDWIYHRLEVRFINAPAYAHFANLIKQHLKVSTPSIYYPKWTPAKLSHYKWVSTLPRSKTTPRYPIYVISKGRAHSRLTSKTLEAMDVPYYIVVEPSEIEAYAAVIDINKILVLPNDSDPNNLTGPGYARNCCRDHAWANGFDRHWVMDDNIHGFYRLHQNRKYRVADGAIFRAAEDFVDRYENVWVAGFQYRFFAAAKSKYPPYVANTRIYSCLLIDNRWMLTFGKEQFLWRERYNEDTILSLDTLENGFCTVQFNSFLQGKTGTQKLKGGNTEVFYGAEGKDGAEDITDDDYNPLGTVRKSLNLLEIYPEVTKIVERYGRVHHHVDFSKYKKNQLKLRRGVRLPTKPNNYGMRLIKMTDGEIAEEAVDIKPPKNSR